MYCSLMVLKTLIIKERYHWSWVQIPFLLKFLVFIFFIFLLNKFKYLASIPFGRIIIKSNRIVIQNEIAEDNYNNNNNYYNLKTATPDS